MEDVRSFYAEGEQTRSESLRALDNLLIHRHIYSLQRIFRLSLVLKQISHLHEPFHGYVDARPWQKFLSTPGTDRDMFDSGPDAVVHYESVTDVPCERPGHIDRTDAVSREERLLVVWQAGLTEYVA